METLWFMIVAVMIAAYVVLDGFDLGAGFVSAFVARTPGERRAVIGAIGPFWDGNEVWLLAGGGVLYFAFPKLYASSFAGFYLPLMMVLWLLILRGIAIEFGSHLKDPLWRSFWDTGFAVASILLAVFYGAALGNVVRGVPLDKDGVFFLPLWTSFTTTGDLGILDWYTILVGVLAAATLALHGALWVSYRVVGSLQVRTAAFAQKVMIVVVVLTAAVSAITFQVQPMAAASLAIRPWSFVFPLLTLAGLVVIAVSLRRKGGELHAFLGSCLFIVGMLTSAANSVYPFVLPARPDPQRGLTIFNSSTSDYGLSVALYWWVPALVLTTAYFVFLFRRFKEKVEVVEAD
ncbi:MAG: cytochrome d ubiquinol oxidase subunit II [Acidobacteriota bacterium]